MGSKGQREVKEDAHFFSATGQLNNGAVNKTKGSRKQSMLVVSSVARWSVSGAWM